MSVTHAPLEVVSDAVMSVGVGDRIATLPVSLLDAAVTVSTAPRPRRPRTPPTVDRGGRYHYKRRRKTYYSECHKIPRTQMKPWSYLLSRGPRWLLRNNQCLPTYNPNLSQFLDQCLLCNDHRGPWPNKYDSWTHSRGEAEAEAKSHWVAQSVLTNMLCLLLILAN